MSLAAEGVYPAVGVVKKMDEKELVDLGCDCFQYQGPGPGVLRQLLEGEWAGCSQAGPGWGWTGL